MSTTIKTIEFQDGNVDMHIEDISHKVVDRMDGLVNIEEIRQWRNSSKKIIKDLEKEGFEQEEIIAYLAAKLFELSTI